MGKQILIVLGGGRPKGNTAQLAADSLFWTFQQAVSYYKFALVDYIGFHDRGMLLAGGCGDTNGPPQIGRTDHLERAFAFGRTLYPPEALA